MSEERQEIIFKGERGEVGRHDGEFYTYGAGHLLCVEMAQEIERLRDDGVYPAEWEMIVVALREKASRVSLPAEWLGLADRLKPRAKD